MTQIYNLKNTGLNNKEYIMKVLAGYGIYECLDLTRELSCMEESELKEEIMRFIISNLEARMKILLFG